MQQTVADLRRQHFYFFELKFFEIQFMVFYTIRNFQFTRNIENKTMTKRLKYF